MKISIPVVKSTDKNFVFRIRSLKSEKKLYLCDVFVHALTVILLTRLFLDGLLRIGFSPLFSGKKLSRTIRFLVRYVPFLKNLKELVDFFLFVTSILFTKLFLVRLENVFHSLRFFFFRYFS